MFDLVRMGTAKPILDQFSSDPAWNPVVVLVATQLTGALQTCREQVRTYLHEADKVLHQALGRGGSSVLVTRPDSPVMYAAKLAKMTVNYR